MSDPQKQPEGFFYQPNTIRWILRVFYALSALLFVVDFFVHRHIEAAIEKVPAFYAIYGFVACVILVIIAAQMRKALMRDENYYTRHEASLNTDADIADAKAKGDKF